MNEDRVFIGLGSNLDDRRGNLERGLEALDALPRTQLVRASAFHWTPPWGFRDQPWFLNAASEIETGLAPRALMDALLEIEKRAGRIRNRPNGPRVLDLDILLYGDRVIEKPGDLVVPHPRMAGRAFVLVPLAEIAPDVVHPVEAVTVTALLERLGPEAPDGVPQEMDHEKA